MSEASTRERGPEDNRLSVETPEGVEFELELAGFLPRTGAYLLDLCFRIGALFIINSPLEFLGGVGLGLIFLNVFIVTWFYYPIFELWFQGQTPGKRIFGIRVVNVDGTPVGWYGSLIRNLLRVADILPFGYVFASISMMVSGRFQRLGDLAAQTVVVYRRQAFEVAENRALPPAEPAQFTLHLRPQEQEAIVDFAERSAELGEQRSAELASILSPLVDASTGEEARQKLFGLAHRIVRWG